MKYFSATIFSTQFTRMITERMKSFWQQKEIFFPERNSGIECNSVTRVSSKEFEMSRHLSNLSFSQLIPLAKINQQIVGLEIFLSYLQFSLVVGNYKLPRLRYECFTLTSLLLDLL